MNHQLRGLQISLVVHVVLIVTVVMLSANLPTQPSVIKIDFGLTELCNTDPPPQTKAAQCRSTTPPTHKPKSTSSRNPQTDITPAPVEPRQPPVPAAAPVTVQPQEPTEAARPMGETTSASAAIYLAAPAPVAGEYALLPNPPASSASGGAEASSPAAPASPQPTEAATAAVYLKHHFAYIKELVQKSILYPMLARKKGWEGRVMVAFVVAESGRIEDLRIKESSGFAMLDRNALETIAKVAPFPPPPVKAELIMPIIYKLD